MYLLLKQSACVSLLEQREGSLLLLCYAGSEAISLIYNQMSYTGKYQIIKVAMHKHEYGFWGHNGYILPIYYSCIFTISLIRFLRQTRDLLIMLPRGGQLLIGREAGEIEGHIFLSEKSPALKNTAIHQESNVKPKDLQKVPIYSNAGISPFCFIVPGKWMRAHLPHSCLALQTLTQRAAVSTQLDTSLSRAVS